MKNIALTIITATLLSLCSCDSSGDYLEDGGLSNPEVGMSTVEFFRSHDQLDTLAILIDRAGMEDLFNGQNTVFAPNNLSVRNYVSKVLAEMREEDPQAEFTVNDISVDTLTTYLGSYVFEEEITRENMAKEQGRVYTAANGEERRISLEPTGEYADQLDSRPEYVYLTYKNGEEWDDWDDTNSDDDKFTVKTSNLVSTNGIIHVLQGEHTLFNYESD